MTLVYTLYIFSFYLLAGILLGGVVLSAIGWAWGQFLERHEHDPARVRAVMFLALAFLTTFEMGLAVHGLAEPWAAALVLLVNTWGPLDALLRFPAAHSMGSFFGRKQLALLVVKSLCYACGLVEPQQQLRLLVGLLLFSVWGPVLLFLMAMPLDESEQVVADEDYDVDLLIRAWRSVRTSRERRDCVLMWRTWWYRRLHAAGESRYPILRLAACAAGDVRKRHAKVGRSV